MKSSFLLRPILSSLLVNYHALRIVERYEMLFRSNETLFRYYKRFYVTSTQYRSYRDFPALLVEEDLRCPSVHYFRHGRALFQARKGT
jgi:hypothetical protein